MAAAAIRLLTPSFCISAATIRLAVRSETSIRCAMSPVSVPAASGLPTDREQPTPLPGQQQGQPLREEFVVIDDDHDDLPAAGCGVHRRDASRNLWSAG